MPTRYTVTFQTEINLPRYCRNPSVHLPDVVECQTLKEAESWQNIIDETTLSFSIKDTASQKVIFQYEKGKRSHS